MRHCFLLVLLVLYGCSSSYPVNSRYQNKYDFNQASNYSLYERNHTFSEYQNLSDTDRNSIELAIERAFDRKGFSYKEVEQADFVVSYFVTQGNNRDLAKYNHGVRYCRLCLTAYDPSDKHFTIKPYGSVIVDLVDPKTKRSVWRGVTQIKFKDKDNSRELQDKLQLAIDALLTQYPKNKV